MRKNDLIKMLQELPGNPEVVVWNGYVGDWMHLGKPSVEPLVKTSFKYFCETVRMEECVRKEDFSLQQTAEEIAELKKIHRKHQYEINPYVSTSDIKQKRYVQKNVVMLQPTPRGITAYDRIGNISY